MNNFAFILKATLSIVADLWTLASLGIALKNANKNNTEPKSDDHDLNENSESNDNDKSQIWPFIVILSVVLVSASLLFYGFLSTEKDIEWYEAVAFIVSFISLIIYGVMAYKSFDSYTILPPQKLWQTLFNKIPSHIKNANQSVFNFLILKMDNSPEVNNAGERIKKNYQGRDDFQVVVESVQDTRETEDIENYCGVIFIVGNQCFHKMKSIQKLMDEYSKQHALPIAYIRLGANHIRFSNYDRISETYLDKFCANHLVMRSYRRSEHWIKLSRNSTIALWALVSVAFGLLIAFAVTKRQLNDQVNKISQLNNEKKELSCKLETNQQEKIELLEIFGWDRTKIHLPNEVHPSLSENIFNIGALQEDENFKEFVRGFAGYFFKDIGPQNIKIWLRNNNEDDLSCIYDHINKVKDNQPKGRGSMIGDIADNSEIFVLWPGCYNTDSVWRDPKKNTMAWANVDHGEYAVCELITDSKKRNQGLEIKRTKGSSAKTLNWYIKEGTEGDSNGRALYGFSYQNRLAIEIDFDHDVLKDKDKRIYIQNLEFRNTLRRFTACINSFLNYYYDEHYKESK